MFESEPYMRQFVDQLFLIVQGSLHNFVSVTDKLSGEEKAAAWKEYNQSFEERVLTEVLAALEKNNCSVLEVCHAALKLLDVGARMFAAVQSRTVANQPGSGLVVPLELGRELKKRGYCKRRA
ncbi:MAG: hypothetical protein AB1510_04030 [Bacillota bacterium]